MFRQKSPEVEVKRSFIHFDLGTRSQRHHAARPPRRYDISFKDVSIIEIPNFISKLYFGINLIGITGSSKVYTANRYIDLTNTPLNMSVIQDELLKQIPNILAYFGIRILFGGGDGSYIIEYKKDGLPFNEMLSRLRSNTLARIIGDDPSLPSQQEIAVKVREEEQPTPFLTLIDKKHLSSIQSLVTVHDEVACAASLGYAMG